MQHQRIVVSVIATITLFFAFTAHANPANERLLSMSEPQRRTLLAVFLFKSGEQCSNVTKTFYQGSDNKGNAYWNATCSGGHSFSIQVNNNATGLTGIVSCDLLKALNKGKEMCFTKLKNQA